MYDVITTLLKDYFKSTYMSFCSKRFYNQRKYLMKQSNSTLMENVRQTLVKTMYIDKQSNSQFKSKHDSITLVTLHNLYVW